MNLKTQKAIILELIIIILILTDTILLLTTIFYDFPPSIEWYISIFDLVVCIILAIDYAHRMIKVNDKKSFVKSNWIDIIAMLPDIFLNSIFSLFGLSGATGIIRLLRLIRVARVIILFRKNIILFTNFIKETHLDKLLLFTIITVISASIAFFMVDKSAATFGDGLWYVLVTIATVGYGDVVPTSTNGRIIGIILIIIGIFLFSTLTGAISSIYTKKIEKETKNDIEERLDKIEEKLDKLLSEKDM